MPDQYGNNLDPAVAQKILAAQAATPLGQGALPPQLTRRRANMGFLPSQESPAESPRLPIAMPAIAQGLLQQPPQAEQVTPPQLQQALAGRQMQPIYMGAGPQTAPLPSETYTLGPMPLPAQMFAPSSGNGSYSQRFYSGSGQAPRTENYGPGGLLSIEGQMGGQAGPPAQVQPLNRADAVQQAALDMMRRANGWSHQATPEQIALSFKLGNEAAEGQRLAQETSWKLDPQRAAEELYRQSVARGASPAEADIATQGFLQRFPAHASSQTTMAPSPSTGGQGQIPFAALPASIRDLLIKSQKTPQAFEAEIPQIVSAMDAIEHASPGTTGMIKDQLRAALESTYGPALKSSIERPSIQVPFDWTTLALAGLNPHNQANWWTEEGRNEMRRRKYLPRPEIEALMAQQESGLPGQPALSKRNDFIRMLYGYQ